MRARVALALFLATAAAALAANPPPPDLSQPRTETYLRTLDNAQLRLLRRTIQACRAARAPGLRNIRDERDPCVISGTDKAVADADDADLKAFHDALPPGERYDENRASTVWQVWVEGTE